MFDINLSEYDLQEYIFDKNYEQNKTFVSFLAYKNVFASIPVVKYFFNSLIFAGFATLGQVLISALAGY